MQSGQSVSTNSVVKKDAPLQASVALQEEKLRPEEKPKEEKPKSEEIPKKEVKVAEKKPKEEKPEYTKKTLLELNTKISDMKDTPDSYSLAVRVEMILSLALLQQLLRDPKEELDEQARQLLTFLKARWTALSNSAAWDIYSRRSKINVACGSTAAYLLNFFPDTLALKQIVKFDIDCEQLEKDILEANVEVDLPTAEANIYKFIYKSFFDKQPIRNAWSLIPKSIRDAGSDKDTWRILLSYIVPEVRNRLTFVKIVAQQVERDDWQYFFSRLTNHGHLFNLILGLDITQLVKLHEGQSLEKQTDDNFELRLYKAADKMLRESNDGWGYFQVGSTVGSKFKSKMLAEHGCENQTEVLALAYALFETYRRVRGKLGEYTSDWGRVGAIVTASVTAAPVADKDVKVAGSDILMAFCLQAEQFNRVELEGYIAAKIRDKTLTSEKVKEFREATKDGVVKMLIDVLCVINDKVRAVQVQTPVPGKK